MTDPIQRYTEAVGAAIEKVGQEWYIREIHYKLIEKGETTWYPHDAQAAINAATLTLIEELCGRMDRDYSQDNADKKSKAFLVGAATAANDLRSEILTKAKGLKG